MDIKIDYHEKKRIKNALEYYEDKGHNVSVENLDTGDFVFEDKVAFEYKTFSDLFSSIKDGRLFDESIRQSEVYPYHFVIIEGTDKKRQNELYKLYRKHIRFNMKQYYGAVARLNTYTNVVYAPSPKKAFGIMLCQAEKCLDSKPLVRPLLDKSINPCFNLLRFLPNIKEARAKLIVESLDLNTYEDLMNMSYDDLIDIKGIGNETANNILNHLHNDYGIK